MNFINGQASWTAGLPIFLVPTDNLDNVTDRNMKLNDDRYELFVNNHFVGTHTMLLPKEDASIVSDFLHEQGFKHVNLEVTGDHIIIHTDSREEAQQMEKALRVFSANR
ncbi:hypothetical protein J2S74_004870 [Evansella vedderi]|uniref:Uncharacterized protein n=1 Tax=Evansella vedderi TaxID=38282 RepID=A0ABU0A327_9BACI|nr:hypothetical protein [Evansella vedderi]MDQ0257412.1 hypothetical protein [Evansella vedderi]